MSRDFGAHERIDALTRRVEALERAMFFPAPPPREFANACTECGQELALGVGYSCPRAGCPCGLDRKTFP